MPFDFISNTDQKVPFFINPTTAGGKAAKIDGLAKLTFLTGGATFVPSTDEERIAQPNLVGWAVSEDVAGASTYEVEADADLGEGVVPIKETGTYTYSDAPAISVGASAGTPVLKA